MTNFAGVDEHLEAFHRAGVACLPECYLADNPQATPDAQRFEALRRGWRRVQPVIGTYGGLRVEHYLPLLGPEHRGWSAYLAETGGLA